MLETKFNLIDSAGRQQEATTSLTDYREAADSGLSYSQFLSRKFDTDEAKYGSVLSQALLSNNLILNSDRQMGIKASSMKDVINGTSVSAGAIVSPDGSGNGTPAGRLFFPEVILQTINANLTEDKSDFFAGYESLLSGTESIAAPEFKQPKITVTAPEASESMSAAQLAEPAAMVSITAADSTTPIPTKAIGLMISEQALSSTSLDLVNIVMGRQAYGERVRMVTSQLADCINGNSDLNMAALPTFAASTLDAASTNAANFSQKAWIHYLRDNYETMGITNIVCTVDTALFIEGRTGKPTNQSDDPNSPRIDSLFSVDNLGITAPRVFIVDASVVPDETVVGLDNRWALRRYINVTASYEAIEEFALRRAKAFRVDYGQMTSRFYDDAFRVMTF